MKKIIILFVFFSLFLPSAVSAQSTIEDVSFTGIGEVTSKVVHTDSWWWPLSRLIGYFFENDVQSDIIYLILVVPFITFVIAFFRQVIGVSTFGIYTPLLTALSFLLLGIYFGLAVLLLIILVSYLLRNLISKFNLLYIPRTSFLLSSIALSFLLVIWFSINFGSPVSIGVAIFPMLMISTISEKISSAQSEEGITGALIGVVQTIIVAVLSYYFVIWQPLVNTVMWYPEFIILPLVGNLLLGKFTGLRLVEYFRFRALFKETIEE